MTLPLARATRLKVLVEEGRNLRGILRSTNPVAPLWDLQGRVHSSGFQFVVELFGLAHRNRAVIFSMDKEERRVVFGNVGSRAGCDRFCPILLNRSSQKLLDR